MISESAAVSNSAHESADAPPTTTQPGAASEAPEGSSPEKTDANPKKLVIFCDGTWNDLRMPHLTNVARLAKCVKATGRMVRDGGTDTVPQIVFYDEGVGTDAGVSRVVDQSVRFLGGTIGAGLDEKIRAAYKFLVLNYNPEDEIFIFGFSRGAYTARSLCGMIRKCGVLKRSSFEKIPAALDLYRDPTAPSHADAQQFRRQFSHPVLAGEEDYTDDDREEIRRFRDDLARRGLISDQVRIVPDPIRRRGFHIRYLGLWDTVGSMGVPTRFSILSRLTAGKYKFHDERASSLIESLRHAVAVDEIRKTFDVTPVSNVDELNQEWATVNGFQVDHPTAPNYKPYGERAYQQQWFPGDHGAVGGGNAEPGLSSVSLLWVAQGAMQAGLSLDISPGSELTRAFELQEPCANWKINKDGTPQRRGQRDVLGEIGGYARRRGPATAAEISISARERWRRDPSYRPSNLMRFVGLPELKELDLSSIDRLAGPSPPADPSDSPA